MRYEWLPAFVVFAEHLSFTAAARELHLSQPALHVQIRKLAEEVGRPLYRRDGRSLALTPEGHKLAAFGRELSARGAAVLAELRGQSPAGPVVLAAGQGALLYLLGPALRRFPKQRFALRITPASGPQVVAALRDARADVGVAALARPPAELSPAPLGAVGQKVVLPASHPLARRRSLRPAQLDGEPLVVAPAGSPHRTMLESLLAGAGATLAVAVEATGWELMLHFARCGVAPAVVNDFCPTPPGTVARPLVDAPNVTYHVLSRPGLASPAAAELRRRILTCAR